MLIKLNFIRVNFTRDVVDFDFARSSFDIRRSMFLKILIYSIVLGEGLFKSRGSLQSS